MSILVRELRPDEVRAFLEVHRVAIRTTAAAFYSSEVIAAWAPWPITDAQVGLAAMNKEELRIIAILDGRPVGIGALVPELSELKACYVHPTAGKTGVGRAIVEELERMARAAGLRSLHLDSSLAAEHFYLALGYDVVERGEHVLSSGVPMACVKMMKRL